MIVPLWASAPPQSVLAYLALAIRPDSGHRLWIFLSPITGIIALVNLVAALLDHGPARSWWLMSSASAVAIIAVTFAYFVPVLLRLPKASQMPEGELTSMVRLWVRLNWIRMVVLAATWLAALKAFGIASA